jgi:uncharacterized membrane protein
VSRRDRASLAGLAALLAGSGILHRAKAEAYQRIVPAPLLRWRSEIVAVSGAAEIGCALLPLLPRTRRVGAYASAMLFVAVFPANIQMALDGGSAGAGLPSDNSALAWLRLPLQVPLVWWALSLRHSPHPRRPSAGD